MSINMENCLVILGPTASGKTSLACELAYNLDAEIISADSRQVYKHLNIGTGKDLASYIVKNKKIKHHLIDIVEPGEIFYLHNFMEELLLAFNNIIDRKKLPIICGGSGMYLDALRKNFVFTQIKEDADLRLTLDELNINELRARLSKFPTEYTNHVDLLSKKRLIRGLEIATYLSKNKNTFKTNNLPYIPYYIGIDIATEERKELISQRLVQRIENGLVEEVESLLKLGIKHDRLQFFGLEYKFVSFYLQEKIDRAQMHHQLETAIFQFAKRQMTWFRKMEKEGVKIHWLRHPFEIKTLSEQLKRIFQ